MFMMFYQFEVSEDGKDVRKVDYDWNKLPSQQSQAARDNAKIDIIKAILTHPTSFKKFINPGGFETLKALSKEIQKLEGKTKEDLPLALPATFDELAKRNLTGKELIGIFANHNANHAVLQYTDVAFADPIQFDGRSRSSLSDIRSIDGKLISRNMAEFLAAVVDNAKEPVSSFLNLNTYTSDIVAAIVRSGYSIETAVSFVSQPIIKHFTERYFNEGANPVVEATIMQELEDNFNKKGIEKPDVLDLNTSDMKKSIKDGDLYSEDQYRALVKFQELKKQGTALADLVRAMRADTKGAGPTMADNEVFLRNVEKAKVTGALTGVDALFRGEVYPMMKEFTESGIEKPNKNILQENYPWMNKAFEYIKDQIGDNFKGRDLTVKDIEYINYSLLSHAVSGYSFFNPNQRADIIKDLPDRLESMIQKNPDLKDIKLLKLLQIRSEDKTTPIKRIEFVNTGSLNSVQKDEITQSWEYLLEHINEDFRKLGEDLVKYTYFTAGFNFTPFSFSHLIPVSFYDNLRDDSTMGSFNGYLDNMFQESKEIEQAYDTFIDQFYRNNWDNSSYVPSITRENDNITGTNKDFDKSPEVVYINPNTVKNKSLVISNTKDEKKFVPYIKKNLDSKIYLFKFDGLTSSGSARYVVVDKLGVPNIVIEYQLDNSNMTSIFDFNKAQIATEKLADKVEDPSFDAEIDSSIVSGVLDTEATEEVDIEATPELDVNRLLGSTITTDDAKKREEECNG